jgi:hypothetical protein
LRARRTGKPKKVVRRALDTAIAPIWSDFLPQIEAQPNVPDPVKQGLRDLY